MEVGSWSRGVTDYVRRTNGDVEAEEGRGVAGADGLRGRADAHAAGD